jgi:hypothetical protein
LKSITLKLAKFRDPANLHKHLVMKEAFEINNIGKNNMNIMKKMLIIKEKHISGGKETVSQEVHGTCKKGTSIKK